MSRRKMSRADRRLLKKAGFGREFKGLGGLAVALDEAAHGYRESGYVQQADSSFGERTRRRVRRERWKRWQRRVLRPAGYGLLLVLLFPVLAALAVLIFRFGVWLLE
ncbi:MAG: hypothetical protein IJX33_05630 [Akkermansia sp.]|nr:hypothetical protein [Akkermansia sp.]